MPKRPPPPKSEADAQLLLLESNKRILQFLLDLKIEYATQFLTSLTAGFLSIKANGNQQRARSAASFLHQGVLERINGFHNFVADLTPEERAAIERTANRSQEH